MSSLKKNLIANLFGRIWGAAISILLIPQYIKYLGIESYGLVGFYGTLIGSMAILDLGLSTTLNRELSKYKAEGRSVRDIRNLTFSLECIYWAIGLTVGFFIMVLAGFIASYWVQVENLPIHVVKHSIMLMGAVVAFQWPISLYDGGLRGLDKHILNNVIAVILTTIRAAGVILILHYYSATLASFFYWQAALSLIYVLVIRLNFWNKMPLYSERPSFSKAQLKSIWRFVAGMTSVGIVTFFLAQVDKIVLSKLLPLSQFGYYNLSFTVATSIALIAGPISLTFFPRFTHLVAVGNEGELKTQYHSACRLMASLIFPVCFVLIFFTHDILRIWTNNTITVDNSYIMARVLIIGSMLNALMILPYNLVIAHGWMKFSLYQNGIAALILVPLLFIWTSYYGALGATFVWLSVNIGYVLIGQPLMHRKLLRNELAKWYWNDTCLPMIPPLLIILIIKLSVLYFFPGVQLNLVAIGCIFGITFFSSMIMIGEARVYLTKGLLNYKPRRTI